MSQENKTALIVGATGLIGQALLNQILETGKYQKVIVLLRRELDFDHPKLEQKIIDFDKVNTLDLKADHIFCTLGTTIKTAGSKAAFRKVDEVYPFQIAENTFKNGASLFTIVTSMGADKNSSFFYNKVKGAIEDKLKSVGFEHLGIFRPSMLLGHRKESRIGEKIGKVFMSTLGFLIPKKYKAIHVDKVALAMLQYAKRPNKGLSVIESGEMF
ncbi:UNVERIFIED_CONTAM: hypothetical protein GTU68_019691 [Idotea baltica]|nr:hypothetical protein [Idotea baltica]